MGLANFSFSSSSSSNNGQQDWRRGKATSTDKVHGISESRVPIGWKHDWERRKGVGDLIYYSYDGICNEDTRPRLIILIDKYVMIEMDFYIIFYCIFSCLLESCMCTEYRSTEYREQVREESRRKFLFSSNTILMHYAM